MPIAFTDKFSINKENFNETGAFDVILDVDSKIFIDPALLGVCTVKEFKGSKEKVEKYFSSINSLIKASINSEKFPNQFWKRADQLLTFKEISETCFGYSKDNTDGNSIGPVLRKAILQTIQELILAGENDPIIYELLGVFQENIGCDRISDLLTFILLPEILSFTERVVIQFGLGDITFTYGKASYRTCKNEYNGKPILLLPIKILSPLPVANSYDDIDLICMENERVKQEINAYFDLGRRKKLSKAEILSLMKSSSSFRKALITAYKATPVIPYDFVKDPVGEYSWYAAAKKYVYEYPFEPSILNPLTLNDVFAVVQQICQQFKKLIEENCLCELLYDNDKKNAKHERAAQQLFFGIADSYCIANNIDLTRESNVGRGPVDFKLSKGAKEKVLVEVKLTSNGQLKHGIETQLLIYMEQEKTQKAIYLIIDNGHSQALMNFYEFHNNLDEKIKHGILFIVIDGTINKKSASKASGTK